MSDGDLIGLLTDFEALDQPSFTRVSILLEQSNTITKRKRDKRSPCLNLLLAQILPQGLPIMIIEKFVAEIHPLIPLLRLIPKSMA